VRCTYKTVRFFSFGFFSNKSVPNRVIRAASDVDVLTLKYYVSCTYYVVNDFHSDATERVINYALRLIKPLDNSWRVNSINIDMNTVHTRIPSNPMGIELLGRNNTNSWITIITRTLRTRIFITIILYIVAMTVPFCLSDAWILFNNLSTTSSTRIVKTNQSNKLNEFRAYARLGTIRFKRIYISTPFFDRTSVPRVDVCRPTCPITTSQR